MTVALFAPFRSDIRGTETFADLIRQHRPDLDLHVGFDGAPLEKVDVLLGGYAPKGALPQMRNLKAIITPYAGVNVLLSHPELPDVPLTRVIHPLMTKQMTEFVVFHVLRITRGFDDQRLSPRKPWNPVLMPRPEHWTVGMMGMGELGGDAARALQGFGYNVRGWSRTARPAKNVEMFAHNQLGDFLKGTQILVNLLPLTGETENLIDASLLAQLPKGGHFINCARGVQVVEGDLVEALDSGHLASAALDVFRHEPLDPQNPLFSHPQVYATPHIAALTLPEIMVDQVLENLRRFEAGEPLLNVVDRRRGY